MKRVLQITIVIFLLFTTSRIYAQTVSRCATDELIHINNRLHPGYQEAINRTFQQALEHAQQSSYKSGNQSIYRIPVVVHIVYNKPEENLPDSLVYSQIEVLNRDFRRRNPDTVNTRAVFDSIVSDAGIEFYLADIDPDGMPTTGITRTHSSKSGFPFGIDFSTFSTISPDTVKYSIKGGVDAWPTDKYLNIWVCNIGSVLGQGWKFFLSAYRCS